MDRLSHLLPRVLKKRGLHEEALAAQTVYLASRWIAETYPNHTAVFRSVKFQTGVLLIESTSPEIEFDSKELMNVLNQKEGIRIEKVLVVPSGNTRN